MGKRKSPEEGGVSLDSLMDALTNVVGILILVFILVQLNVAQAVKQILSQLPDVTEVQLVELEAEATDLTAELSLTREDWVEKEKEKDKMYAELKAAKEKARLLEETMKSKNVVVYDIASLEAKQKELELQIAEKEKEENEMLAEVERLEALLAGIPDFVAPTSKVVKMPNPRPIPVDGKEYKFFVANGKVIYMDSDTYLAQAVEEVERVVDQVAIREAAAQPWAEELATVLGGKDAARDAWPIMNGLAPHFQPDDLVKALGMFKEMGYDVDSKTMELMASIAGYRNRQMADLARDIKLAGAGDLLALRAYGFGIPEEPKDGKMRIKLGETSGELPPKGADALKEYLLSLDREKELRRSYADIRIVDGDRLTKYMEERARLGDRNIEGVIEIPGPTSTRARLNLNIREGGGESDENLRDPASTFQRAMRSIKAEKDAYAWFYVHTGSFDTYLEARQVIDEFDVPAGWQPYWNEFYTVNIDSVQIARKEMSKPPKSGPSGTKQIKGAGKTLD